MKFRLTGGGYQNFTGPMGTVDFEDGLSVRDVLPNEGKRLAALFGGEWEDGSTANVGQIYMDNMHTPAPFVSGQPGVEQQVTITPDQLIDGPQEVKLDEQAVAELQSYTEDQLAAVADDKGIAGLRAIAEPLGIKSNSIRGLIDAILAAVAKVSAPAETDSAPVQQASDAE
jgi:hypothetical protein